MSSTLRTKKKKFSKASATFQKQIVQQCQSYKTYLDQTKLTEQHVTTE